MINPLQRQMPNRANDIRFALQQSKMPHSVMSGAIPLRRPKFQGGGAPNPNVMSGPLVSPAGGRTDLLPIDVASGSYVLPADVVSGLPGAQGSSLAGHNALNKLFSAGQPYSPDAGPYGASVTPMPHGQTIPWIGRAQRRLTRGIEPNPISRGGRTDGEDDEWRGKPPVSIMAAGGEHVIPPHVVEHIGLGSLKRGHAILDAFVKAVRERNIKELKKLPPPAKD
jgi:hypothetical protein